MKKYRTLFILLAILMSGVALIPYIGLSSERFGWQQYADAYQLPVEVDAVDFAFEPDTVVIATGETVMWTNRGETDHTVTSNTGLFDSGTMVPGDVFTHTFSSVGDYGYRCTFHPDLMTGTVTVVDQVFPAYVPIVVRQVGPGAESTE